MMPTGPDTVAFAQMSRAEASRLGAQTPVYSQPWNESGGSESIPNEGEPDTCEVVPTKNGPSETTTGDGRLTEGSFGDTMLNWLRYNLNIVNPARESSTGLFPVPKAAGWLRASMSARCKAADIA
jgi:hypothetical protein